MTLHEICYFINFHLIQFSEECLQECKSKFGCRWFTFHSHKSPEVMCVLYSDCPSLDEACETCISGERRCEDGSSTTSTTTYTTRTTTTTTATTTTTTTTTNPTTTTTTTTTTTSSKPGKNVSFLFIEGGRQQI